MNDDVLRSRRFFVHAAVATIAVTALLSAGVVWGDDGSASVPAATSDPVASGPPVTVRFSRGATPLPGTGAPTQDPATETPAGTDAPVEEAAVEPLETDDPPSETQPPAAVPAPTAPPSVGVGGLRVWSNGDSTSYFMSVWFLQMMAERGATQVQPSPEYQISSGLLNANWFDWLSYIASEMAAYDPNIVVFMVGANDAHPGMDLEAYRARVGAVMDQLAGRTVVWVGQPAMPPSRPDLVESVPGVNQVFAEEASKRPWVRYVDVWSVTSDASGNWAEYLTDENGVLQQVRAGDGVHFTYEGGRRLALAVLAALP